MWNILTGDIEESVSLDSIESHIKWLYHLSQPGAVLRVIPVLITVLLLLIT